MRAEKHPAEARRISELNSYDILDTGREQEFDDIVALAAGICGTEASTITFIDADRQWFKAAIGMDGEPAPIDMAVCAHTIVADGFVEIEDTLLDPRTSDNPGAQGPNGLRFYAGAQLITSRGLPIGTLCVLGLRPKKLSPVQRTTLAVLANQVVKLLELRVALKAAAVLRKEVDHRVKNSLQLVASLMSMQRRAASNQEVRDALAQSYERVVAVASLHDTMQQSGSGTSVNLRQLLQNLGALIGRSLTSQVRIEVDATDIEVSPRVASSVAVIVNEFVSNSLKHAFAEDQAGTIRIACGPVEDGMMELRCTDDGKGLDAAAAAANPASAGLGTVAIQASAEQIDAKLASRNLAEGYEVTLRFDPAFA